MNFYELEIVVVLLVTQQVEEKHVRCLEPPFFWTMHSHTIDVDLCDSWNATCSLSTSLLDFDRAQLGMFVSYKPNEQCKKPLLMNCCLMSVVTLW